MSGVAGGALAGALIAAGIAMVIFGIPWWRSVSLEDRVGPYLADAPRTSRLLNDSLATHRAGAGRAGLRRVGAWAAAKLGGSESLARRLERAGRTPDVVGFRAEQIVAALAGSGVALVLAGLLWMAQHASPVALLVLVGVGGAVGWLGADWWLGQRIQQRERLVALELPTIAELLVLSVTAGEGIGAAIDRLARTSDGVLSSELGLVIADVHSGVPMTTALDALAQRVSLPAVSRFVDSVVIALERGTPLADVLRAQAGDAREAGRHALIAEGGRREIRMMIPVVFLILPVTVLFAVFPGLAMLRLDF